MKNDSCSKIKRVLEKLVVGLGNSWPLSFVEGNETLEENFPFGVTVVVFVASTEATEPLKGFRVLSLLPETHPRPVYVTRGTNFIRVVRINPQSDQLLYFDVYRRNNHFISIREFSLFTRFRYSSIKISKKKSNPTKRKSFKNH